jgi:opacity protein-like surface antigen
MGRKSKRMINKNFSIGAAILLVLLASAMAADVTGKWTAEVPGNQGNAQIVTLNLKADGTNLTGTLDNSSMPGAIDIKDGKIQGDNVSFYIIRKIGENDTKVVWKGTIVGEEIQFTREAEGGMGGPGGAGDGAAAPSPKIIAKRAK